MKTIDIGHGTEGGSNYYDDLRLRADHKLSLYINFDWCVALEYLAEIPFREACLAGFLRRLAHYEAGVCRITDSLRS